MVISLFEMASRQSAEVLSSDLKLKEDVMGLVEKTHALDKFHWGVSCSPVGCEFNVDELPT